MLADSDCERLFVQKVLSDVGVSVTGDCPRSVPLHTVYLKFTVHRGVQGAQGDRSTTLWSVVGRHHLSLNIGKTKEGIVDSVRSKTRPVSIMGEDTVDNYKYLGVHLSDTH
ncbi:unnamed protein product [Lampetra planeri]